MFRSRTPQRRRRGAILLVVLTLLTLFAVIGLTFVLYAESAASAARTYRESVNQPPDVQPPDPTDTATRVLFQLLFPINGNSNQDAQSAFMGWSLAQNKFGYDQTMVQSQNLSPFSGTGPFSGSVTVNGNSVARSNIVNFSWNQSKSYIVDREWSTVRTSIGSSPSGTFQSMALPYTYPGGNGGNAGYAANSDSTKDMFLAVVDPNTGTVLQPSFYRTYGSFKTTGSGNTGLESTNPNWSSTSGQLMILRPRPQDHVYDSGDGRGPVTDFPYPTMNADGTYTGDVQNLLGKTGQMRNDAIWMYPAGPVSTWNNKQYTALVAVTILDLNGRINLSAVGNLRGTGNTSVSSTGLSVYEINPNQVLDPGNTGSTVHLPLLQGSNTFVASSGNTTSVSGRYGPPPAPTTPPTPPNIPTTTVPKDSYSQAFNIIQSFNGGNVPPFYSRADADSYSSVGNDLVNPIGTSTSPFPTFSANRYFNNVSTQSTELSNHPAQFSPDAFGTTTSSSTGRRFDPNDVTQLIDVLYNNVTTPTRYYQYQSADVAKLLPTQLISQNYIANQKVSNPINLPQSGTPSSVMNPATQTVNDPAAIARMLVTTHSTSLIRPEIALTKNQTVSKNANGARLGPIDMNRALPDYRSSISNMLGPDNVGNWQTAQTARQHFARDIFVRLAALVGLIDGTNVVYSDVPSQGDYGYLRFSTQATLPALRQLAQVAVNMVDYIDIDDVATIFTFNPTMTNPGDLLQANGLPPGSLPSGNLGSYVVVGTEIPRLVLNEVYAEVGNHMTDYDPAKNVSGPMTKPSNPAQPSTKNFQRRFWVELVNPMQNDPSLSENGLTRLSYPTGVFGMTAATAYSPYQIAITVPVNNNFTTGINDAANVTGSPKYPSATTDMTVQLLMDRYDFDTTDFQPDGSITTTNAITDTTYYPVQPVTPSTAMTNTYQYVVSQYSPGNNGVSAKNLNGYFVLGPAINYPGQTTNNSAGTPAATVRIKSQTSYNGSNTSALEYDTGSQDQTKLTANNLLKPAAVYLRRLANPYIAPNDPFEPNFVATNPINPYVTVDRAENITPFDNVYFSSTTNNKRTPPAQPTGAASYAITNETSFGRPHLFTANLFAAQSTQVPAGTPTSPKSTFFLANDNLNAQLNWLTHLDRQLMSPIELAHVSAVAPHLLTSQFEPVAGSFNRHTIEQLMLGTGMTNGITLASGLTTLNPGALLPTLDFLAVHNPSLGVPVGAREHGKLNVNTAWHKNVVNALLDARAPGDTTLANYFTTNDVANFPTNFFLTRSPVMTTTGTSANDNPLTAASAPATSTTLATAFASNKVWTLPPNTPTSGVTDTTHAWALTDPLKKVWNNTTTTSDTFLVVMTVGFFEVRAGGTPATPVVLGKELFNKGVGDLRKKYIAVLDRSNLAIDPSTPTATFTPAATFLQATTTPCFSTLTQDINSTSTQFTCTAVGASGSLAAMVNGSPQSLTTGSQVRIGFGDRTLNQGDGELFTVASATPSGVAGQVSLTLSPANSPCMNHPAGSVISNVLIGNPGPQQYSNFNIVASSGSGGNNNMPAKWQPLIPVFIQLWSPPPQ
ncbi:hypothetical protein [Fimbriiglobus ruber]|uniref:Uncharacterized protein n=1 Tax=Fimbriiglobus ruber TaxID=1908690 RepID=A0A225DYJ4_9BACT|nr:hypothetical protein [Fimbriiglobus ruber]OWK43608.1 hypothetical protein FRUB_03207 [Fimbriiglobus ruber]